MQTRRSARANPIGIFVSVTTSGRLQDPPASADNPGRGVHHRVQSSTQTKIRLRTTANHDDNQACGHGHDHKVDQACGRDLEDQRAPGGNPPDLPRDERLAARRGTAATRQSPCTASRLAFSLMGACWPRSPGGPPNLASSSARKKERAARGWCLEPPANRCFVVANRKAEASPRTPRAGRNRYSSRRRRGRCS